MRVKILFTGLMLIMLTAIAATAQKPKATPAPAWGLNVPKGETIVLKIPGRLIGFDRVSTWTGAVTYSAVIEQSQQGGYMVAGLNNWRTAGWTMMRHLELVKVSREKNFTEVELQDPLYKVKLRFDNTVRDINAAFAEVAFIGTVPVFEASDYYKTEVMGRILPQVFTGKLASIPEARKMDLLRELRFVDGAIKTEKYKGGEYLSVDVGGDTEVYNSRIVDQPTRLGHTLNQRVLYYFKRLARITKFHPEVDGIKITILVPYKDFVSEYYNTPYYDRLEAYAPMETIRQFVDDELTNQEFAEEAILLVNGNRMQPPPVRSL